jgi:hypothetical protein
MRSVKVYIYGPHIKTKLEFGVGNNYKGLYRRRQYNDPWKLINSNFQARTLYELLRRINDLFPYEKVRQIRGSAKNW